MSKASQMRGRRSITVRCLMMFYQHATSVTSGLVEVTVCLIPRDRLDAVVNHIPTRSLSSLRAVSDPLSDDNRRARGQQQSLKRLVDKPPREDVRDQRSGMSRARGPCDVLMVPAIRGSKALTGKTKDEGHL